MIAHDAKIMSVCDIIQITWHMWIYCTIWRFALDMNILMVMYINDKYLSKPYLPLIVKIILSNI
jgi:hypothetical protein